MEVDTLIPLCKSALLEEDAQKIDIYQRLRNHYEIQRMAFSSGKICGFPPWGLLIFAENSVVCTVKRRFPCGKLLQNPVAVFSCSG